MKDRLKWLLWRRRQLAGTVCEFASSISAYATADCQFEGHNRLVGPSVLQSSRLGRGTYVNAARLNKADTGRFCSIGYDALVRLGEHPVDRLSTHPVFYSPVNPLGLKWVAEPAFTETSPVILGSDVGIGARSIVLGGIRIGDGAIIAAGAVVVHDVPAFAIVAGCPACVLQPRFADDVCTGIMTTQWWNAPMATLRACASMIGQPLTTELAQIVAVQMGDLRDPLPW